MNRFGIISIDSPLWRYLGYIFDAAYLTVLWVIFSLPVVTIGASTVALYTVALRKLRGEDSGHTASEYHKAFKANLSQGILAGIITGAAGLVVGVNIYNAYINSMRLFTIVCLFIGFVLLMVLKFIFPVIARFSNSLANLFAIAFSLSVRYFGWTLMLIIFTLSILLIAVFVFWPLLIFSVGAIALIDAWVLNNIFAQYIVMHDIQ